MTISGRTSESVVMAVADAKGVDPIDLQPLNDGLDPDALNNIFRTDTIGELTFEYEDTHVVVTGDGRVSVNGRDNPSA